MPKVHDSYLEARRQGILDAASRVFSRRGVHAATMAEVAAEAGITPGAIYRYFPSKEELAAGCLNDSMRGLDEEWIEGPGHDTDPLAHFISLADRTVALLDAPGAATVISCSIEAMLDAARAGNGAAREAMLEDRREVRERIGDWLTAAKAANQLDDSVDPRTLAAALISLYFGLRLTRLVDPEADVRAQWQQIAALLRTC